MSLQLALDFTVRPHNNAVSMAQAENGKEHYEKQDACMLRQLQSGRKISARIARAEFGIEDPRARIHALKKAGYIIKHSVIPGTHGSREWYL